MVSFDAKYAAMLRESGIISDDEDIFTYVEGGARKKKRRPAPEQPVIAVAVAVTGTKKKKKKAPVQQEEAVPYVAEARHPPTTNWRSLLVKGGKEGDTLLANASNAQVIFTHDPKWRGVLAFDEFIGDIVALKKPPWPEDMMPDKHSRGPWTDSDTARAGMWLTREYKIALRPQDVGQALRITAERYTYHPVRMWLQSLVWDKESRLDDWLPRLCGAKDTPYTRAVGKNFLLGAVARAMEPGCQVDSMPVFEGKQGLGKSSMLRILAGPFFLETSIEVGNKDSYQVLRGKWIVEWGEMGGMSRAEVNKVKQYISERTSTYRPSYGTRSMDFLRQCVFAGTTNNSEYLKDETGARRFHPVLLREILLTELKTERKQLFAEAYARFSAGEKWFLDSPELVAAHAREAEERRQQDPWEQKLREWADRQNERQRRTGATTHFVLENVIGIATRTMTRADEMRCAAALRMIGWDDVVRRRAGAEQVRHYRPKGVKTAPKIEKVVTVASVSNLADRRKQVLSSTE